MADDTPEHRTSVTQRSGDTHVIGEDGALRNVDAEARDKAAADAARAARAKPAAKPADGAAD